MNNKDMAIVVIGFDGYSDLWDNYFELLNKYWGDRSYPVYLVNNTKKINYENVNVINCGENAEWSRKVQIALREIKEKYICLLLEDFFTGDKVDNRVIDDTVEFLKSENIRYCKLENFSKVKGQKYKGIDYINVISQDMEYGVSLQPAIWEREYLKELVGDENYNAWIFEYDRVKESEGKSNIPLEGCIFDSRNILKIQHGVVQGKFLPRTIKYFKDKNYEFNTEIRPIMSNKEYMMYCSKNKGKHFIPKRYRGKVKKILNVFGMKFVSDKFKG